MYQYRTHMHNTCAHSMLFLPATATQWGKMVKVARLNPAAMFSQVQSFVSALLMLFIQSPNTWSSLIFTRLPLP